MQPALKDTAPDVPLVCFGSALIVLDHVLEHSLVSKTASAGRTLEPGNDQVADAFRFQEGNDFIIGNTIISHPSNIARRGWQRKSAE